MKEGREMDVPTAKARGLARSERESARLGGKGRGAGTRRTEGTVVANHDGRHRVYDGTDIAGDEKTRVSHDSRRWSRSLGDDLHPRVVHAGRRRAVFYLGESHRERCGVAWSGAGRGGVEEKRGRRMSFEQQVRPKAMGLPEIVPA